VTTAARYAPGQHVIVTVTAAGRPPASADLVAGSDGRVVVPVDLGPANLTDQYVLGNAVPTNQVKVHVTMAPVASASRPAAVLGQTLTRQPSAMSPAATLPATGGPGAWVPWAGFILLALGLVSRKWRTDSVRHFLENPVGCDD